MCLNPLLINKPRLVYSSLRVVRDAKLPASLRQKVVPTERNQIIVGCGKCVECLKKRQNDLATRCVREAERTGSMVFLTLTYDDAKLPIYATTELVDKDTGEVFADERCSLSTNEDVRKSILSQVATKIPRYDCYTDYDYDSCNCRLFTFTPSLRRRDFQLYLKYARVRYEREHNKKLPEFKYVAVGEYGPKTCRPHIHVAFFGLKLNDVLEVFRSWREPYLTDCLGNIIYYKSGKRKGQLRPNRYYRGFLQAKQVKYINDDNTFGFQIASKYIGKYMVKGKFDCESVLKGFAEKPRICISSDFGCALTQKEIDYWTCQDLFGKYDMNDISHLSAWQLETLCQELGKRSHVNLYGYNYGLPLNLKRRLFYKKVYLYDGIVFNHKLNADERKKYKTFEIRYEPTQIQSLRLALLEHSDLDEIVRECRQVYSDQNAKAIGQAIQSYFSQKQIAYEIERVRQEADFCRGYYSAKSDF